MLKLQITLDGQVFDVELDALPKPETEAVARVNGEVVSVRIPSQDGTMSPEWLVIGDRPYEVFFDRDLKNLRAEGQAHSVQIRDLNVRSARPLSGDGRVKAPIPGVVTQVLVAPGESVQTGQTLLILEAMKMENQVRAPREGVVAALNVSAGHSVMLNEVLAEIA
jgi:biotin carboxyl carrier protein